MKQQLIAIFGDTRVLNCLSITNRKEFLIADEEETSRCYIVPEGNTEILIEKCFKVINSQSKEIQLLSVDACFLTREYDYNGQKCDCIIFSENKLCFVELKTNATSIKKIKDNIKKAIEQLGCTINHFDENGVDFAEYQLEAYIVLKPRLYRTSLRATTSKQKRRKKFFDEFEVDLYEISETHF
ncbi:MAG: hypothetical protein ACPG5B_02040 [Chitinophagales bacterium]